MRNEVGLTPHTRKLWENKPPEFRYPPRDRESNCGPNKAQRAQFLQQLSGRT